MPHAYCNECQAQVTVRQDRCLLDHHVDPSRISNRSGRHAGSHRPARPSNRRPVPAPTRVPAPPSRLYTLPPVTGTPPAPLPQPSNPGRSVNGTATLDRTSVLIEDMWNTSEPDARSIPSEMDPLALDSKGLARKAGAVLLTVGMGLLVVGVLNLFGPDGSSRREVEQQRSATQEAVAGLQPILADLADGVPQDPLAAPLALDAAGQSARGLFTIAANLDESPFRTEVVTEAQTVITATRALQTVTAFHAAIVPFLAEPALPALATDEEAAVVAEGLAGWESRLAEAAAVVPRDAKTEALATEIDAFVESIEIWKAPYLDGLRTSADVTDLIDQVRADLATLRQDLADLLVTQAAETATTLGIAGR